VAVATNGGAIYVSEVSPMGASWPWRALTARVRHVAWAQNDLLVASCTDGIVWVYSASHQRLLSLPLGTANLGRISVNASGSAAIVLTPKVGSSRSTWIGYADRSMQTAELPSAGSTCVIDVRDRSGQPGRGSAPRFRLKSPRARPDVLAPYAGVDIRAGVQPDAREV
jgi:hypothetical protein